MTTARKGELAVGIGVLALAGLVAWATEQINVSPVFARIGPKAFPWGVAAGLCALGLALMVQAARGGWHAADDAEEAGPPDWRALAWLGLGLLLNVALIEPLGFVIASTLLFCCTARAFGSARPLRDLGVAVLLSVGAFVGFDRLLGISIGAGVLEGIL